jgi:ABC-2 type transport system permease protein
MSAVPPTFVEAAGERASMPGRRLRGAYLAEAKYETIRLLRTPAFAIPFLGLPIILYLLFGVVIFGAAIAKDPQAGRFIFTGFSALGMMGPGLFGFCMAVAVEREQGLLRFKRALPMPPAAYLLAKMIMALLFAVAVMATMIAATPLAHLKLTIAQTLAVSAINILGSFPFCAIGLFLGTRTTSRSAPAFANVLYQLMMHLSGIFYPLPRLLRMVAPLWPTYHLQQMVFGVLGLPSEGGLLVHATVLAGLTWLLTTVSVRRLARLG